MKKISLFIISSLFFKIDHVFAAKLKDASDNLGTVATGAGVQQIEVGTLAGTFLKGGLSVVGLIFFILVFYGGFSWMIARGNEEKVKKAQNTVVGAVIGLIVVLAAYAITTLIGNVIK